MPKLKPETILSRPEEDAAITAAAMQDPDAMPYTEEKWAKVRLRRGHPARNVTKVPTSIRLDARVVKAFKATGEGWQTRMNDVLLDYVQQHDMLEQIHVG
jgi:uncharacterized protein (DUF4415 family)